MDEGGKSVVRLCWGRGLGLKTKSANQPARLLANRWLKQQVAEQPRKATRKGCHSRRDATAALGLFLR